jgi:hypothetical protein
MVLTKLYVKITTAPGAGNDWDFTVRADTDDDDLPESTGITVNIGEADTTGSDAVNTYTCFPYDNLDIMAVPTSDPVTSIISWSLVCYVAPIVTDPPAVVTEVTVPDGITVGGATVYQDCTSIGDANATIWGTSYGLTGAYGSDIHTDGNQAAPFSWHDHIIGLASATHYHYQAYATNIHGTAVGADATFVTLPDEPTLVAPTVRDTHITFTWTEAVGGGGTTILTLCRYSTIGFPTTPDEGTMGIFPTENEFGTVFGLENNVLYYFSFFTKAEYGADISYSVTYDTTTATPLQTTIGDTFYVSTTGNDGNDGSGVDDAHAWLTPQHAMDIADDGDTVCFVAGDYNTTNLETTNSGVATGYIRFTNYSGGEVNIHLYETTWEGGLTGDSDDYIMFEGLKFDGLNADHLVYGGYSCRYGLWFVGGCDFITVKNCTISYTYWCSLYCTGSTYMVYDNVTLDHPRQVASSGEECMSICQTSKFVVKDCIIHDGGRAAIGICIKEGCDTGIVYGTEVYNLTGTWQGGIYIEPEGWDTFDIDVYNNVVHDNVTGSGFGFRDEHSCNATGGTVTLTNGSNAVVGVGTSFYVYMVGGTITGTVDGVAYTVDSVTNTTHLTLTANYNEAGGSGLAYTVVPLGSTNHDIRYFNNIAYNCNTGLEWSSPTDGFEIINHCYAVNNTFYSNALDGYYAEVLLSFPIASTTDLIFRNNIIYSTYDTAYGFYDKSGCYAAGILSIDHNLYYNSGGSWHAGNQLGTDYLAVDPLFTSIVGEDFSIQAASPATDAGSDEDAPAYDCLGTVRPQDASFDMGAFEEGADPPTVSTLVVTSLGSTTTTLNGEITDLGAETNVIVTFEYGLNTSYGLIVVANESPMIATGTFHANITGLSSSTTYHYRAKVVGHYTTYGLDTSFATTGTATTVIYSSIGGLLLKNVLRVVVAAVVLIGVVKLGSGSPARILLLSTIGIVGFTIISAFIETLF